MKAILFLMAINFSLVSKAEEKTWEYPQDIPVATAPTLELAGSRPAGVLRYLLSQGARGAELSSDGKHLPLFGLSAEFRNCGRSLWRVAFPYN